MPALSCAGEWLLHVKWYRVLNYFVMPKLMCECLRVSMSTMLGAAGGY